MYNHFPFSLLSCLPVHQRRLELIVVVTKNLAAPTQKNMAMMGEETSFPRGGNQREEIDTTAESDNKQKNQKRKTPAASDTTTPSSSSDIKKDFLFGGGSKKKDDGKSSSSKRRKTDEPNADVSSSNKNSLLPLGGGGVVVSSKRHKQAGKTTGTTSSSVVIEALGFSKLAKGSKLLACVREVQENYAIVSLPNLLTAYILPQGKPGSAPKYPLSNTLEIGQTIAVVVTKISKEPIKGGDSRRRIQVSALPQAVNPRLLLAGEGEKSTLTSTANRLSRASVPIRGQIMSVEDHGCVIELGFGKRGFVSFDQVHAGNKDNNYMILEEDEDEPENDDDDAKEKRPIILQKGRLYDFLVLPVSSSTAGSKSGNSKEQSTTVFPLSLPSPRIMARKTVSSLTTTGVDNHKNKTTTIPFSFSSLSPGWLVQVKVEAIASNGLCVSLFGNIFRGSMELNHLGATLVPDAKDGATSGGPDGGWKHLAGSLFQNHQILTARILAVDVPTKLVRLSLAPHILTLTNPARAKNQLQTDLSVGTVVSDCTVIKLDPGIGALLALPPQYNNKTTSLLPKSFMKSCDLFQNPSFQDASHIRKVYVHISKALDESQETGPNKDDAIGKYNKEFAPSTTHDVRILNTGHWMEGIAAGGCAPSILDAHVLTHGDLVPGKVYRQVPICAHLPGGSVLVQLGGMKHKSSKSASSSHKISGLIPPVQLFDIMSKDSSEYRQRVFQTKYAIDAKVDVRVLWVDPIRKKCLVTAKKMLVQAAPEDMISNYADAKVGQVAVGFVSRVDDEGLCVTFCNKVYGKVTSRSLAAELGVEDHRENYSVGDAVTCRVVKLKRLSQKGLTVDEDEMEVDGDDDDDDDEVQTKSSGRREHWELTLSLNVHKEGNEEYKQEEEEVDILHPQQVRLRAGAILPEKSMKIVELVNGRNKQGGYVPGYAIVSIKSKHLVDEESLGSGKMLSNVECKLPFSNLLDSFDPIDILSVDNLDALAKRVLQVGKKIKQKGLVLLDPRKSNVDYASGIGAMPVVSLRKVLIQTREDQCNAKKVQPDKMPIVPLPDTNLYVGAFLLGFVAQVDTRHGAFVRFLDGMTGMVPKKHGGLQLRLYDTVVTKIIVIDDSVHPHRILLEPVSGPGGGSSNSSSNSSNTNNVSMKVGDKISKAKVNKVNFQEASLKVLDRESESNDARLFIHCTNKMSSQFAVKHRKKSFSKQASGSKPLITNSHPFYGLKSGQELRDLTVVSVQGKGNNVKIWVTDKDMDQEKSKAVAPLFLQKVSQLKPGMKTSGVVFAYGKDNSGVFIQVGPQVKGFVSGLELSRDVNILNDLQSNIPLGAVIECRVTKLQTKDASKDPFLLLSLLACESQSSKISKPSGGDLVIGRINKSLRPVVAPSLMLDLRGCVGRCCITELDEPDEWENMPLGHVKSKHNMKSDKNDEDDADKVDQNDDENMTAAGGNDDDVQNDE
jgi:ribosomal protein S1